MTTHTILVVDDEPASLRAVTRALADEQQVLTVNSGAEGLAALAAQPVSLMIVDQRMPEMSGTELLARCAEEQPNVIRVLLTGYTDVETLVEAINAGHVYHYLTKPWEPHELRLVVRRGLERYDTEVERRRLVKDLEQACSRVQREAEQKGRLLTLAAHELGTPLHLLSNALELMTDMGLPAQAHGWLDTACRSATWLGRGLEQMASAARWRRSRLKLHCRPIDLVSVVQSLAAAFQPVVAARNLALRVDMTGELPGLIADPVWIERALSNLLSNAVRFTPDGGSITVTTRARPAAVDISVTDTGVGIDASVLDEVFEPFSAAGGDVSLHTSGRFEFGTRGLGLGLAIAKAIIDQHGGTIAVRSQVGTGSQFTITLPLHAATADAPEA